MSHNSLLVKELSSVIEGFLVKGSDDQFKDIGQTKLADQLHFFIDQDKPIELVLPGFPCKSPNFQDKSSGGLPDFGEVVALKRLESLCEAIDVLYPFGVNMTLVSDGTTFNDVVGVPDDIRQAYNETLRHVWRSPFFHWMDLSELLGCEGNPDTLRKQLIKQGAAIGKNQAKYITAVQGDEALSASHDHLCSFLYNDLRLQRLSDSSEDEYMMHVQEKAFEMMRRGQALTIALQRRFPEAIRLSVHQYDNSGPKYSMSLIANTKKTIAPWHKVTYRQLDGTLQFVDRRQIDSTRSVPIYYQEQLWLFHEVDNEAVAEMGMRVVKSPQFGLSIQLSTPEKISSLSSKLLESLVGFFSFICIKGCHYTHQEQLVEFCQPFGEIYQWQFGPVHVVKPEENPNGFVHSLEKTPIHWDLSMLPLSHERVQKNEAFCADIFMLYCQTPPQIGEGETTIVDGGQVLREAGRETVRQWKEIKLTYNTKMTYFGGEARTFPLVDTHPFTGETILRYQEGSQSELQDFSQTVEGLTPEESHTFIQEMNDRIYASDGFYTHTWEAGDLVILDNYLTLHGRNAMTEKSAHRELWRVQIIH